MRTISDRAGVIDLGDRQDRMARNL
jgi:hypothetical protein